MTTYGIAISCPPSVGHAKTTRSVAWWSNDHSYQGEGKMLNIEGAVRVGCRLAGCMKHDGYGCSVSLYMGGGMRWGLRRSQEITPLWLKGRDARPLCHDAGGDL
jgi:hypothetical protein